MEKVAIEKAIQQAILACPIEARAVEKAKAELGELVAKQEAAVKAFEAWDFRQQKVEVEKHQVQGIDIEVEVPVHIKERGLLHREIQRLDIKIQAKRHELHDK